LFYQSFALRGVVLHNVSHVPRRLWDSEDGACAPRVLRPMKVGPSDLRKPAR
jgi:hypothetical protein